MERRRGRFTVSYEYLDNADFRLKALFSKLIVLDVRNDFSTRKIEYVAESELFEPVEVGCVIPQYVITIHDSDEGGLKIVAERRNKDDAPPVTTPFRQKIATLAKAINAFFNQGNN